MEFNITYSPRTIRFDEIDDPDTKNDPSIPLRRRRMKIDVATSPLLCVLMHPDGASLFHALLEAGAIPPVHPWETAGMSVFRDALEHRARQYEGPIVPHWLSKCYNLAEIDLPSTLFPINFKVIKYDTYLFHARHQQCRGLNLNEFGDARFYENQMGGSLTNGHIQRNMDEIREQSFRIPRYSVKLHQWVGCLTHYLEEINWYEENIEDHVDEIRRIVLGGSHVGEPCIELCRYWSRRKWMPKAELFVSTVLEALAERPKRHWAKARSIFVSAVVVAHWRHIANMPGSKAAQRASHDFVDWVVRLKPPVHIPVGGAFGSSIMDTEMVD